MPNQNDQENTSHLIINNPFTKKKHNNNNNNNNNSNNNQDNHKHTFKGAICKNYSSDIFGLDLDKLSETVSTDAIQLQIDYLRGLLSELLKMQYATVDMSKYILSPENLYSLSKLYPQFAGISNLDIQYLDSVLSLVHPDDMGPLDTINRDMDMFTRCLKHLRDSISNVPSNAGSRNWVIFRDMSYNVLLGARQESISSGVAYCTSPVSNILAYHDKKHINFIAAPNNFMYKTQYGTPNTDVLDENNAYKQLVSHMSTLENLIAEGSKEIRDTPSISLAATPSYYPMLLNSTEELLLNINLLSALPGAQYSHSHFSSSTSKDAPNYCRGSNTFDSTLRNGITSISALTSWLGDMSLFAESVNVSDSYSTLSMPPMINLLEMYYDQSSDTNLEEMQKHVKSVVAEYSSGARSLGSRSILSAVNMVDKIIGYKRITNNSDTEEVAFSTNLVNKIRKADLLLKNMCTHSSASELYGLCAEFNLEDANCPRTTTLTLPSDWSEATTFTGEDLLDFGDTDYIYTYASAKPLLINTGIMDNESTLITTRLGLLLLAADQGRYINHVIASINNGTVTQVDRNNLLVSLFNYRQLLYTHLLLSLIKSSMIFSETEGVKIGAIAISDVLLLTHYTLSTRKYADTVDITKQTLGKDLVVSLNSKGDRFFKQLEFINSVLRSRDNL